MLWGHRPPPQAPAGSSPEVTFVGGIFDVVANIVEHPMSCCAVPGIKHLEEVQAGTDGPLAPPPLSDCSADFPFRGTHSPLQVLPPARGRKHLINEAHAGFYMFFFLADQGQSDQEKCPKSRHRV
jgi:hypothetical protein